MTPTVALDIEADGWRAVADIDMLVAKALEQAARRSGCVLKPGAEVSVLLSDDAVVGALNRDWRGMDKPTNVLSFPAPGPLPERPIVGDIAVAWETVAREAADEQKSVEDHLTHLLVHGFLHLVGYDHQTEAEASAMEDLETGILADLGIADPYHGSDPVRPAER